MKKLYLVLLAGVIGVVAAKADGPGLILTKKGTIHQADSTRVEGGTIYYVPIRSKAEQSMPKSSVEFTVPLLERGKKYTDQSIDDILALIKVVKTQYPNLRRQLNAAEGDWMVARKPVDPGIANEIDTIVQQFNQSPRDSRLYKKSATALRMVRFRDKTGSHDAKIDEVLVKMKKAYLGFDLQALLARGDAETVSKEELKAYRADAIEAIKGRTTKEEKLELKAAFGKARDTAIRGWISEIETFFNKYKAISVYHKAVEDLKVIKEELCKEDSDFLLVKESDEKMFKIMKEQYSGYDFSFSKFPLGPGEQKMLKSQKPFSSIQPVGGVTEEFYLIPGRLPYKPMAAAKTTIVPFVFLINRTQEKTREFSTVMRLKDGAGGDVSHRGPMATPKLVNGRAVVRITFDYTKLPAGSLGIKDDKGSYVLLHLEGRTRAAGGAESKWIPLSNACRIPVSPPEEE